MKRYIVHAQHPDCDTPSVFVVTVHRSQQHPVRFQASCGTLKGQHLQWRIPPEAARELLIGNGYRNIELEEVAGS